MPSVDLEKLRNAIARLKEHEEYAAKRIERFELTGRGEVMVAYWIGELHMTQTALAYLDKVIVED